MSMPRSSVVIAVVLVLGTVTSARADEPAPAATPLNYVVASVGTTLFYQPNSGSSSGWQHDISPSVGYGRYVTDTITLELDLGPTITRGSYAGFTFIPGIAWMFSTHVYVAARLLVPVDPKVDFALAPGVGVADTGVPDTFQDGISVFAELNVSSNVGRGNPDLGVTLSAGALYSF